MSGNQTISLLVIITLLGIQAGLAVAETGLTRVSRIRAMALEEGGGRRANALRRLVDHPEKFLNSILLLVNICQTVSAILVGFLSNELFGGIGVVIGAIVNIVLVFVFTEAAPKTWALQHADRAALVSALPVSLIANFPPLRMLSRGLIGVSNVILPGKGLKEGPFVSEEELLATVDVALEDDVIESEERALIHSIIEFGDTVVREVMVPRPDMVAVEGRDKIGDVIEVAMAAGYSRIPVYEQGIDDIVGVVFTKDLLRAEREGRRDLEVRTLAREAHFVPETKRVAELLREMQKEKFHMAIVVDEYGGTAGLATLEDLIEELVGEIVDEFDVEEPLIEAIPGGAFRVNARMPIDEVNDLLHADLPTGDWDTIGGLVFNLLGHVPTEGESVVVDGFALTAEKVQGRRIGRVRINKAPDPSAESAA